MLNDVKGDSRQEGVKKSEFFANLKITYTSKLYNLYIYKTQSILMWRLMRGMDVARPETHDELSIWGAQ